MQNDLLTELHSFKWLCFSEGILIALRGNCEGRWSHALKSGAWRENIIGNKDSLFRQSSTLFYSVNRRLCFIPSIVDFVLFRQSSTLFYSVNRRLCFIPSLVDFVLFRQSSTLFYSVNRRLCFIPSIVDFVLFRQSSTLFYSVNRRLCFITDNFIKTHYSVNRRLCFITDNFSWLNVRTARF